MEIETLGKIIIAIVLLMVLIAIVIYVKEQSYHLIESIFG